MINFSTVSKYITLLIRKNSFKVMGCFRLSQCIMVMPPSPHSEVVWLVGFLHGCCLVHKRRGVSFPHSPAGVWTPEHCPWKWWCNICQDKQSANMYETDAKTGTQWLLTLNCLGQSWQISFIWSVICNWLEVPARTTVWKLGSYGDVQMRKTRRADMGGQVQYRFLDTSPV